MKIDLTANWNQGFVVMSWDRGMGKLEIPASPVSEDGRCYDENASRSAYSLASALQAVLLGHGIECSLEVFK
jgi:hypothetical protein